MEYIEELYDVQADHIRLVLEEELKCDEEDQGPKISSWEVAIHELRG